MKGLSYNENKPTWKREEFSLPLATFFCCCMTSSLRRKSQRKKYKAFFTFPGSKYLTMNKIYITLPPLLSLFFWPMMSGMTNNPKVKKCLIVGTHLPNGKVHQGGWGARQRSQKNNKKKPHPITEKPYGIDIRQEARALKPFLLERKKNWHKFFQKEITLNQSNPAL